MSELNQEDAIKRLWWAGAAGLDPDSLFKLDDDDLAVWINGFVKYHGSCLPETDAIVEAPGIEEAIANALAGEGPEF